MKFKHAEHITGRGNVLVVDLEGTEIQCGDKLTFKVVGVEKVNNYYDSNVGLILINESESTQREE